MVHMTALCDIINQSTRSGLTTRTTITSIRWRVTSPRRWRAAVRGRTWRANTSSPRCEWCRLASYRKWSPSRPTSPPPVSRSSITAGRSICKFCGGCPLSLRRVCPNLHLSEGVIPPRYIRASQFAIFYYSPFPYLVHSCHRLQNYVTPYSSPVLCECVHD